MTYDINTLRSWHSGNDSSYAGVVIARAWSPGGSRAVYQRLRAQVATGLITWRWAMVAQAKLQMRTTNPKIKQETTK